MASTKRSKQRLSKSQITKVACKHCYDSVEQRIYINTVSYLKNNHYPSMLEPRTSQTQLSKLFHEPNTKSPAQWQPYIDFYPLNNENKPITKRPKSIFFKKQITLKKNDQSITINKNEQATPRPSIKSRKTIVKKPIVSTEEQKNQSEKPIEWYVRQAIEKFQNQDYITARELWSYYESMEHSDMSQNELLAVQKELLNALKEDMILSDANALNMVEFLLKKRMKGLSIKNIEGQRPLVFCSYCQTFVGGPLSGDWRTGIPIDLAGKHTINLKHWFNEKILVTECKDEYSQKAENILQKSAVDWRHDHSSPIVKQSKYEISPPVDKELGICKKNVHTRLILPYNLSHEFKTSFLTKREVLALKVDDIIDFKMENGFYCNCKVLNWDAAYTVELEYCYDEIKTDSFREDNIDRYVLADKKFAFVNSITKRKNYRFKSLEKGAMLDVKIQGQWFQGIVINKDAKSGQYLFEVNDITHWFHVDDEDNVKRLMM
eukprot:355891_1